MSAFIVSEKCMHACVHAMLLARERDSCEVGDRIGRELYAMNARAVKARYGSDDAVPDYVYSPTGMLTDFHMAKALSCLIHQCMEGDVPSEALYQQLVHRRDGLFSDIVHGLPSWDAAEGWG